MAKFRKKPVVVEAIQYKAELFQDATLVNMDEILSFCGDGAYFGMAGLFIRTLEGNMRAKPGDWIIKGVNGEFYPCKPDIFEKTYEPAEFSLPPEDTL